MTSTYPINVQIIKNCGLAVDFSNILHYICRLNNNENPLNIYSFNNLNGFLKYKRFKPIYFTDTSLKYRINDRSYYNSLKSQNKVLSLLRERQLIFLY